MSVTVSTTRPRLHRSLVVLAAAAALVAGLCACDPVPPATAPQTLPNPRFSSCTIGYFDSTVKAGQPTQMAAVMDEVAAFTHIKFVKVSQAAATNSGLLIDTMVGGDPMAVGVGQYRQYISYPDSTLVLQTSILLRAGTSIGIRRHEMGHIFDLWHHDQSPLMRPIPDPNADYSAVERSTMAAMARNSGCR